MRRRTKKLPTSRGVIYLVVIVLLALVKHIYDKQMVAETATTPTTLTECAATTTQNSEIKRKSAEKRSSNTRSGWAELPAEINDKDLYYAYHTISEEDANDSRRNYAVCFSRELCCPVWVAAPLHPSFKGEAKRSDSYQPDPQLPINIQPRLNRSYGGEYIRGHMLGSAERTSSRACNDQTFYATNVAPQLHNGFNAGGGAWNNMEAFVEKHMCSDTLYVVTGCIFTDYTDTDGRKITSTTFPNRNDSQIITVPTAFYKALLRTRSGKTGKSVRECNESELKCAAFIVGHQPISKRKPTAKEMLSIEELEQLTGVTFFINVPNAPKDKAQASDWELK